MRNSIRNIIDRLRGFIYGDTRNTTIGESAVGDAGILFNGICYDSPALGEMLFYSRSGDRAKVTIKWDSSDATSIYVWNSTARPQPRWATAWPRAPR